MNAIPLGLPLRRRIAISPTWNPGASRVESRHLNHTSKPVENIGRFEIEAILGRGGMGTVYKAQDPLIHREVAVKTISGLGERADARRRFLREAQAASRLHHPNIVSVYEVGEDKGQPYIVTELVEGKDLKRIIASGEPLSVGRKLRILRQVCEGVGYAHHVGIIHRDINPANICLTRDGQVKILDFGIARPRPSTVTETGLTLTTAYYMAPEQILGQQVDHRADIFSVGAIAYELISGKKPFHGASVTAVMQRILHDRPDPSMLPHTEYSPGLEAIVMRALARDLHERYQTLDEMSADVARLARDTSDHLRASDPGLAVLAEHVESTPGTFEAVRGPVHSDHRSAGEIELDSALPEGDDVYGVPAEGVRTEAVRYGSDDLSSDLGGARRMTREAAIHRSKATHRSTGSPVERLLVAGGGMAGAAFIGGTLWGPGGAVGLGITAFILALFLKHD